MGLIEKLKNIETKKKLKEENIRLKAQIESNMKFAFPVVTVQRNIQKVRRNVKVDRKDFECGISTEHIKRKIAHEIMEYIMPFIEFDFSNAEDDKGMIYTGTIYVATGDKKCL